jgi:hypothetical protein
MARKKSKITKEDNIFGTPTMALLPPRKYLFRLVTDANESITITIPRTGTYYDLDNTAYTKEEGSFHIYDEKNKVIYIPSISKVLFGVSKYPDIGENQLFLPEVLVINDDTVDVIGKVIEMITPED